MSEASYEAGFAAVERNDLLAMRSFFSVGGSPNAASERWNQTLLMLASGLGHYEAAKSLIAAGAKVGIKDRNIPSEGGGKTALHYAAQAGHVRIIQLLHEAGATIDSKNSDKATPLCLAVEHEKLEAVSLLLELKANPNHESNIGTPLSLACDACNEDVVAVLLRAGANPNQAADTLPLLQAVVLGSVAIVRCLLEAGADPDLKSPDGVSVRQFLRSRANISPSRTAPLKQLDAIHQLVERLAGTKPL